MAGPEDGRLFGILVTYRRPVEFAETVRRVFEQDHPLHRLVVVDNAPLEENRDTVRRLVDRGLPVDYLPAPENLGPAGGIAVGMERVLQEGRDEDWVVLLDDDDPPLSPTWFRVLVQFGRAMAREDPRTAGVGFGGARFDWRRARLVRPPVEAYAAPVAVDYFPSGHAPVYRVEAVRSVGPFRPGLFFSLDDLEFGLRLRRAQWRLYACRPPRSDLRRAGRIKRTKRKIGLRIHLEEPDWRSYYSLRNLIYILRLHRRVGTAARVTVVRGLLKPVVNLPVAPGRAVRNLRMNVRACSDAWRGRMGRTVEPPVAGGRGGSP